MQNNIRLTNARLKVTEKYRMQRQRLRARRKNKGTDDISYIRQGIIPNNLANSVTKKLSIVNDYVPGKDHLARGQFWKSFVWLTIADDVIGEEKH